MKISIALCTYNGARYLEEQLKSYVSQTTHPDELVVVDDVSKDETLEVLNRFASNAPFEIRVHRNERNVGVAANFEKALGLCRGEVIFPSDQDDVWHPEKITKMLVPFRRPEVQLVACNAELVDGALASLGRDLWGAVNFGFAEVSRVRAGEAFEVLVERNFVAGMAMAVRAGFLPKAVPVPQTWIHDGWMAMAAAVEDAVEVVPECLVRYRLHGGNVVGVKALTFLEKVKHAWTLDNSLLLEHSSQMDCVLSRFSGRLSKHRLNSLSEKVRHYRARGTLPDSRRKRLPIIAEELRSGRYRRFSFNYLAALRDLLR
ncbi:MAG: glycosyltransferase family 2 protein [Myxococcales bacterium]|nr:glycosyltransferase family 2 protein [Myxococcales bacterium]